MVKQYYVIKKVLNNNVVISENEDKKEIIIMGSGIGFGKHVHDLVDSKKSIKFTNYVIMLTKIVLKA